MTVENRERLSEIVATLFEIDPQQLSDDLSPQQVQNWDSLNHLNLCMVIGQEFGIEWTAQEIQSIKSLGDIIRLLNAKGIACAGFKPGH